MRGRSWVLLAALWCLLLVWPASADAIEIRKADHLWQDEQRLLVRLHMDMDLPEVLLKALANGLGADFRTEVRLEYRRGIFGERIAAEGQQQVRLEYSALSRHYVVIDQGRQRLELAPTLGDALEVLARRLGRVIIELEPDTLRPDLQYSLATRVVLDHAALPLPLQWDARLRSASVQQLGWYRWPLE